MADVVMIAVLILIGLALIIAEIIFVPGTTFVGILGLLATGYGIYLTFTKYGSEAGTWVTVGSAVLFGISLYFSFKKGAWDKLSLKDTMQGRVNEGLTSKLQVGQEGITRSAVRPIGKAEFDEVEYEVRSMGNYIDSGTAVRIIKIVNNNIFVEPIN